MFRKIFKNKRQQNADKARSTVSESSAPKEFGKSAFRVVIYKDHDIKGRSLLYDSSGPHRQPGGDGGTQRPPPAPPNAPAPSQPPRPKPAADIKMIGEMVFGSNPMTYKGSTLKIHHIRDPAQLMVSKMFIPMRPSTSSGEQETFDSLSVQSVAPIEMGAQKKDSPDMASSVPVDVPVPLEYIPSSPNREDSGFASSLTSSYSSNYSSLTTGGGGGGGASSSGGDSCKQKRWRRNHTTSLEYYVNNRSSAASSSTDHLTSSLPIRKRPPKLGVAILCKLPDDQEKCKHFLEFFFSHVTLIEGHVKKLRQAVERAVLSSARFAHVVTEGVEQFRDSVWALYSAQRLPHPVWLNMMSSPHRRYDLCHDFITDFMFCMDKLGSKQFFASVVTGVLTNHLAWVPTVTPAGATQSLTYLAKHEIKWVDALATTNPYNPLWAQLGDLYGAIGFPLRLSRVVVTGKNATLVRRLLSTLSYFIRCSEMRENPDPILTDCPIMQGAGEGAGDGGDGAEDGRTEAPAVELTQNSHDTNTNTNNTVKASDDFSKPSREFVLSEPDPELRNDALDAETPTENSHALLAKLPSDDSKTLLIQRMLHSTSDSMGEEGCYNNENHEDRAREREEMEGEEECQMDFTNSSLQDISQSTLELDLARAFHADSVGTVSTAVENEFSIRTLQGICSQDTDTISGSQRDVWDMRGEVFETQENSTTVCNQMTNSTLTTATTISTDSALTIDANSGGTITRCRLSTASIPDTCKRESIRALGRDSPMLDSQSQIQSHQSQSQSCHEGLNTSSKDALHSQSQSQSCHEGLLKNTVCSQSQSQEELASCSKNTFHVRSSDKPNRKKLTLDIKSAQALDSLTPHDELDAYLDPSIALGPEEGRSPRSPRTPQAHELSTEDIQSLDTVPLPDMEQLELERGQQTPTPTHKPPTPGPSDAGTKTPTTLHRSPDDAPEVKDGGQRSAKSPSVPHGLPGRCRSRAPSRARHLSTASTTIDGVLDRYTEVPMPSTEPVLSQERVVPYERNFGRSLLADFSERYLSDFVLHGTSDQNFQANMYTDLSMAVQNSVLDERISESVCVVADTDKGTVKSHTCQYASSGRVKPGEVQASSLVSGILTAVHQLAKLKMQPEFCVMHLEDRLQEIYFKSKMLADFINVQKRIDTEQITSTLRIHASDVPLLLAVAGTHSPHLYMGLL